MVKKGSSKSAARRFSDVAGSNVGLIAYIIGIVAIVEAFVSPFAGIVLSIIGLVFSNKGGSELSGKAKKLNTIALIIGIIIAILTIILAYSSSPLLGA